MPPRRGDQFYAQWASAKRRQLMRKGAAKTLSRLWKKKNPWRTKPNVFDMTYRKPGWKKPAFKVTKFGSRRSYTQVPYRRWR